MVDQDDRIAVCQQIPYDTFKPLQVGRMEPDGWFIQHIEDARRTVTDRPGQLHALPLPR